MAQGVRRLRFDARIMTGTGEALTRYIACSGSPPRNALRARGCRHDVLRGASHEVSRGSDDGRAQARGASGVGDGVRETPQRIGSSSVSDPLSLSPVPCNRDM